MVNPPGAMPRYLAERLLARVHDPREAQWSKEGAQGAETWWRLNSHRIDSGWWGIESGDNEIYDKNLSLHDKRAQASYRMRWIELCRERTPGLKVVTGNFGNGKPEPEDISIYEDAIKQADFLGTHEYWPRSGPFAPRANSWLTFRYRRLWHALGFMPPHMITEFGCTEGDPEGWRSYGLSQDEYWGQTRAYLERLENDGVNAAFWFNWGGWPSWRNFELTGALAERVVKSFPGDAIDLVGSQQPAPDSPDPEPGDSYYSRLTPVEEVRLPMLNLSRPWYTADWWYGEYSGHPEYCWDINAEYDPDDETGNADLGEPVVAPFHSVVLALGELEGWGLGLQLLGIDGRAGVPTPITSEYYHLQDPRLSVGQIVAPGEVVAHIGNSGTTWAHLHWQLSRGRVNRFGTHGQLGPRAGYVKIGSWLEAHGISEEEIARITRWDRR
jgi:hypothetical protein